jgi:sarcosine oxidase subunit gamma
MADTPIRRSPLHEMAARLDAASEAPGRIRLAEAPFLTQVTLRATPGSAAAEAAGRALGAPLPVTPNTVSAAGDTEALWMGPDEWLVVGPDAARAGLVAALEDAAAGEHATVVDVSAHRTVVEIAGAHATDVLRKGCSIDLDPVAFGPGRCAQTAVARAHVILQARTAEPSYRVFARASFAEYVAAWLLDAAAEYRGAPPPAAPGAGTWRSPGSSRATAVSWAPGTTA